MMKNISDRVKNLILNDFPKFIVCVFIGSFILSMVVDFLLPDYLDFYINVAFYGLIILPILYKVNRTIKK